MKAALWHGRQDVRIEDVDEPKVKPGYVKLKIRCCGICGTDLHEYSAGPIVTTTEPHPLTGEKVPVIMGHEFVGDVIEVGPNVDRIKVGDRVAADSFINCGRCHSCKQGKYHLCATRGVNGFHGITGGFADYTIAPEYQLYKLPDGLSYEEGAMSDPIAVGVHAMAQGGMLPGKSVGIFGAGPIGLSVLQVARASGASLIVASEIYQARKNLAKKLGASMVLNPVEGNVVESILKATEGRGLDIAFECVGAEPSLLDAINSTRADGTVVLIGVSEKPAIIDTNLLLFWEKRIVASLGYRYDFPAALALMASGRIDTDSMITKKIPLSKLVSDGFEELRHNLEQIKIMVYPD